MLSSCSSILLAIAISCFIFKNAFGAPVDAALKRVFSEPLPNVPGKTLSEYLVSYKPGEKTPPHRHGSAFIVAHVLSGTIRSKVNDGPVQTFKVGENWTEQPGDHHVISENGSESESASFIAVFVADSNDTQLLAFDHNKML